MYNKHVLHKGRLWRLVAILAHDHSCVLLMLAAATGQPAMLVVVLNTFRYTRYLLVPERNAIHLVLHAEAAPRDMVQAYLQVRTVY